MAGGDEQVDDIAVTQDRSGAAGRLHHLTYMMDSREDVLRAADILRDAGVPIETGPHKHTIGQTFFLYCLEPSGNRFEIGAGGYLIFDPEWKPVVWSEAERAKGQAWGLQTVSSLHTYGTPPVGGRNEVKSSTEDEPRSTGDQRPRVLRPRCRTPGEPVCWPRATDTR